MSIRLWSGLIWVIYTCVWKRLHKLHKHPKNLSKGGSVRQKPWTQDHGRTEWDQIGQGRVTKRVWNSFEVEEIPIRINSWFPGSTFMYFLYKELGNLDWTHYHWLAKPISKLLSVYTFLFGRNACIYDTSSWDLTTEQKPATFSQYPFPIKYLNEQQQFIWNYWYYWFNIKQTHIFLFSKFIFSEFLFIWADKLFLITFSESYS